MYLYSEVMPLGSTWFGRYDAVPKETEYAATAHLEGRRATFIDEETMLPVQAILVRNISGVTLLPRMLVSWASGYRGRRVNGYTVTAGQTPAGVVDPSLKSGVRNGDLFWLITRGPTTVITALTLDPAIGAESALRAATATGSTASTTAGRVDAGVITFTATQTTDGTLFAAAEGLGTSRYIGYALSAATTNQTNTPIRAYLTIERFV